MQELYERTALLLQETGVEKLKKSRVLLFGLGGVGGYAAEALARAGVGSLHLIDGDKIAPSNLNRQIYALSSTVGRYKTDVAAARIYEINPDCQVKTSNLFYLPENADEIDFSCYDYIIDAIDTVSAKLEIAVRAKSANVPLISCMGTGNKLDAGKLYVSDIYKTSVCPLARVMRRELKARGVEKLKVVCSSEEPIAPKESGVRTVGSVSFVPPVAGFLLAGEAVKDLIK